MVTTIGSLAAIISANTTKFKEGIKSAVGELNLFVKQSSKVDRNLQQLGKNFSSFGKTLTASVTLPVAALGVTAVKAFAEEAEATAKLGAALRTSGQDVNGLLADYKKFASEIQNVTTVGDETTLGMLQVATSMGITGEAAKKVTTNAIGLASAFNLGEEAAIKVAAAVAAGDATMIRRYIPTLKSLKTNTEVLAAANKGMSDGFEIAKAAALEGLGPWKQVLNSFGDLQEQFGKIILEGLQPLIKHLKGVINWFSELSPNVKKTIVVVTGIAAAIGPVLLGIGALISALPLLATGLATARAAMLLFNSAVLLNPYVAAAAAVVALGFAFKEFSDMAGTTLGKTKGLLNTLGPLGQAISDLLGPLDLAKEAEKDYSDVALEGAKAQSFAIGKWKEAQAAITAKAKATEAAAAAEAAALKELRMAEGEKDFAAKNKNAATQLKEFRKMSDEVNLIMAQYQENFKASRAVLAPVISDLMEAQDAARAFSSAFNETPAETLTRQREVLKSFIDTAIKADGTVTTGTQNMIRQYDALGKEIEGLETQSLGFWGQKLPESMQKALSAVASVVSAISSITSAAFALDALNLENKQIALEEAHKKELEFIAATSMSESESERRKFELNKFYDSKRKELLIKEAKGKKASALMGAVVNTAQAVVGALAMPPPPVGIAFASIIGALGLAQVATIAAQPIPTFAEGGLAFEDTLAVVGDNPGAKTDPEIIAPLSKLKDMLSQGEQTLRAVIHGEDLILVMDRTNRRRGFIQ